MRVLAPLASILGLIAAAVAAGAASAADYPALVRGISKAVQDNYYDPHLHGADWTAATRRYEARAQEVHNDAAFRALASQMLGELKSSHLDLVPPQASRPGSRPAFKTQMIDGRDTVVEAAVLSDARAQGVQTGDILIGAPPLAGPLGSAATVKLQGCAGGQRTLQIRREAAFWPPPAPNFHWRTIRTGPSTRLGYLEVDAFDDDGAELADKAMADLADTDGLIIDLRHNHGGNASAVRLASYFVPKAGPSVVLLSREYLQALGHSPRPAEVLAAPRVDRPYTTDQVQAALKAHHGTISIWTEDLGEKLYRKPVVVLIGPETASAAEGFAWIMRLRSPAMLVGEPSGGELLSAETFDIGQGWGLRVPTAGVWAPDGQDYGDRAVPPHVLVKPTRATLCQGRDVQLETALRLVQSPTPGVSSRAGSVH